MLTSTIIFFIIPLISITLLYYCIARTLKKASKLDPFNNPDLHLADQRSSRKIIQSRKIVIRLLGKLRIEDRANSWVKSVGQML